MVVYFAERDRGRELWTVGPDGSSPKRLVLADDLRQEFSNLALNLVTDLTLTRGGCLAESAGTVIDGTVERRWQRSVASLGLASSWEADLDAN